MNLLIIGSGWLAQPLARHWQQQGHTVRLTTRQKVRQTQLQARGFDVELFELGDVLPAAKELDVVVFATTCKNLKAHQASLNALPSDTHKLFISSTSVCANNGQTHNEFSTALNPSSPLVTLEACFQQDPQASILRLAGLVGPQRHPGRFGQLGRPLKNPHAPVNLIHLDDAVGLIDAVVMQGAWGRLLHGCAPSHPNKQDFYTAMAAQLALPAPSFNDDASGSHKMIDGHWTCQLLGYSLQHPDVFAMPY